MSYLFGHPSSNPQDRSVLAKMVLVLFDHWQLDKDAQAVLLGIAATNHAALARYRKGTLTEINRDQQDRIGHLLAIHKNLRLLFPQNRELAYRWMSTRNKDFENLTPIEVVKEWGFAGLLRIRTYLERALAGL
jgi:uncharacterized protein (DUF2384 family)